MDLPNEMLDRILEYSGHVKCRNGKYMKQIPKDDFRYELLLTIPIKSGNTMMIYNQMCYQTQVFFNGDDIQFYYFYMERHPNYPSGEMSYSYSFNGRSSKYVIGCKWEPYYYEWNKQTKKWIQHLAGSEF